MSEQTTTSESIDELPLGDQIMHCEELDPIERLKQLAHITHNDIQKKGLKDPDRIKDYCFDMGVHEVVGTGLCMMSMSTVCKQLGEYSELFGCLNPTSHGGEQDVLDSLSNPLPAGDFTHDVYYALQQFYGHAIYALVIHEMEIFNTEAVLDETLSIRVYELYSDRSISQSD